MLQVQSQSQLDTVVAFYRKNNCNLSKTADDMKLSYGQLRDIVDRNEDLSARLHECRESLIDIVEDELVVLAQQGNLQAIKFFLEHRAPHRGYGKSIDINTISIDVKRIEVSMDAKEAADEYSKTLELTQADLKNLARTHGRRNDVQPVGKEIEIIQPPEQKHRPPGIARVIDLSEVEDPTEEDDG